jgi:hypothetical protein
MDSSPADLRLVFIKKFDYFYPYSSTIVPFCGRILIYFGEKKQHLGSL